MKTADLQGAALDYYVAEVEGMLRMAGGTVEDKLGGYSPSTKWAHGGPLIDKHNIAVARRASPSMGGQDWVAQPFRKSTSYGATPLQAICRAVVRAAFGDEVDEVLS